MADIACEITKLLQELIWYNHNKPWPPVPPTGWMLRQDLSKTKMAKPSDSTTIAGTWYHLTFHRFGEYDFRAAIAKGFHYITWMWYFFRVVSINFRWMPQNKNWAWCRNWCLWQLMTFLRSMYSTKFHFRHDLKTFFWRFGTVHASISRPARP